MEKSHVLSLVAHLPVPGPYNLNQGSLIVEHDSITRANPKASQVISQPDGVSKDPSCISGRTQIFSSKLSNM
jgi:hypothetical protein